MDIKLHKFYPEIKFLLEGATFTGQYKGVKYSVNCKWSEDYCVDIEILSFEGADENTSYWLNNFIGCDAYYLAEVLDKPVRSLPEVREFQKRVDFFKTITDEEHDIADKIIELIENNE